VLYLEPLNVDFGASNANESLLGEVAAAHAVVKANAMMVPLSMNPYYRRALEKAGSGTGFASVQKHSYLMQATAGVVEASNTLSHKHDWLQMQECGRKREDASVRKHVYI